MPRELKMLEVLDDTGQRLWPAYRSARAREQAAEHQHRDATRAMRCRVNHSDVRDPAITARYHVARDELADARDARRIADMHDHAYRRWLVAQASNPSPLRPGATAPEHGA